MVYPFSSLSTFISFYKSYTWVANIEHYDETINNDPNKLYFEKLIK